MNREPKRRMPAALAVCCVESHIVHLALNDLLNFIILIKDLPVASHPEAVRRHTTTIHVAPPITSARIRPSTVPLTIESFIDPHPRRYLDYRESAQRLHVSKSSGSQPSSNHSTPARTLRLLIWIGLVAILVGSEAAHEMGDAHEFGLWKTGQAADSQRDPTHGPLQMRLIRTRTGLKSAGIKKAVTGLCGTVELRRSATDLCRNSTSIGQGSVTRTRIAPPGNQEDDVGGSEIQPIVTRFIPTVPRTYLDHMGYCRE